MLAQFSIWPLDDPHMSDEVADVTEILDRMDVDYQVGPMSTTVEGDWDSITKAIQACHVAVRTGHSRVLTSIAIDDDSTRRLTMDESIAKVKARRESAS